MWNGDSNTCDIFDTATSGVQHQYFCQNIRHWTATRLSGLLGQIRGNDRLIKNRQSYHWHQIKQSKQYTIIVKNRSFVKIFWFLIV